MRGLDEVIGKIASLGMMPSLCTACYREGRSGENFKHLAQSRNIKEFCYENALLSLKEYVEDSATGEVKDQLEKLLKEELTKNSNGLADKFKAIEKGERDVHV